AACTAGVDVTYDQLDPVLVQDGDLIPGVTAGSVVEMDSTIFGDLGLPKSEKARFQYFESDGKFRGGVAVFLYDSKRDVTEAFDLLRYAMGDEALRPSDLGEQAALVIVSDERSSYVEVVFTRCNAVVDIRLMDMGRPEALETHAKNLDARLKSLLCP
ncbi:MAG: hypothetical protein ACK2TV_15215, partial [Anaerolineales bacterium]